MRLEICMWMPIILWRIPVSVWGLSLIHILGYYTGLVFECYVQGVGYPVCGGGRYDELLAKFGFPCPATGFALTIDRVLDALDKQLSLIHI